MFEVHTAKGSKILLFSLEAITVAILTVLVIFAILGLVMEVPSVAHPPFLGSEQLGQVVDHILAVFVLIELLATAVAYIHGKDTVRRIFEAMLVALARKLISLDLAASPLEKVGSLALLLVAVGLAWLLMCGRCTHDRAASKGSAPDSSREIEG